MYWKEIDKDGTMFDFLSYYEQIADWLPSKCIIAEVGVANGKSSLCIASLLQERGKLFDLRMIDSLAYGREVQLKEITTNIVKSGLSDFITFEPYDSLNGSTKYPDGLFDFVFIDASHEFEPTKADIRCWMHKVKDGGIVAGHDYYCPAVKDAVDLIVPARLLRVYETENKYGVWEFTKTHRLCF